MSEPDFDQLAGEIIAACVIERNSIDAGAGTGTVPGVVSDYLRQVWNARGNADLEKIHASPHVHASLSATLNLTLRGLDR